MSCIVRVNLIRDKKFSIVNKVYCGFIFHKIYDIFLLIHFLVNLCLLVSLLIEKPGYHDISDYLEEFGNFVNN